MASDEGFFLHVVGEAPERRRRQHAKDLEAVQEVDLLFECCGLGFQLRLAVIVFAEDGKVRVGLALELSLASLVSDESKLAKALVGLVCPHELQNTQVIV